MLEGEVGEGVWLLGGQCVVREEGKAGGGEEVVVVVVVGVVEVVLGVDCWSIH